MYCRVGGIFLARYRENKAFFMLSHQAVKLLLQSCWVNSGLSRVQTTKHVYVCRETNKPA